MKKKIIKTHHVRFKILHANRNMYGIDKSQKFAYAHASVYFNQFNI